VSRGVAGTAQGCGTNARYNTAACRCEPCRNAHRKQRNLARLDELEGRPRTFPAIGVQRRIRALSAIGWSFPVLAVELGITQSGVARLTADRERADRATTERVDALYQRLCMTPGPSAVAKARAVAKGWAPPLAYDDIDDPDEVPDTGATGARGVDLDEWARLVKWGEEPTRAAARLGVGIAAIERAAERAGRPEIATLARPDRSAA